MAYKTILTYFLTPGHVEPVLEAALPIARAHDAHVIGLHVMPDPHIYMAAAAEMSAVVYDAHKEFYDDLAEKTGKAFERRMSNEDINSEWRRVNASGYPVAEIVNTTAASTDLVITTLAEADDDLAIRADLPTSVVMGSGRPVLCVPKELGAEKSPKHITLAWDGGREAVRAAFDALPLLKAAEEVRVIAIDHGEQGPGRSFTPADEIAGAMARQGVSTEADRLLTSASTGEALLAYAKDHGSDLLVMGCYGHTRLREFVFGGATRHVLKHAHLPVLMSH